MRPTTLHQAMWQLLLSVLGISWCGAEVAAQERPEWRHEITVSIAPGEMTDHRYRNWRDKMIVAQQLGKKDPCGMGCADADIRTSRSVSYFYHFNRQLAVGAVVGNANNDDSYNHWTDVKAGCCGNDGYGDVTQKWSDFDEGAFTTHAWYLLPACKLTWHGTRTVRLYSKVGLGAYVQRSTLHTYFGDVENRFHSTIVRPTYQFTPFGIEFGRQNVTFSIELGYGIQTIFGIGLSYRFGPLLPEATSGAKEAKSKNNN